MQGPEKNSYKEFDNEKKFLRLENSPPPPLPPHNFSNYPSLMYRYSSVKRKLMLIAIGTAPLSARVPTHKFYGPITSLWDS